MKALILMLAALSPGGAPLQPQNNPLQGLWRNPKGTLEVRIGTCGPSLCGTVVAASPSAVADARNSGYPALVGMQILHDYRPQGPGEWRGTIFIPDMGRDFSSHIEMIDTDHVRVSGCLLGKYICKSQLWRRA